MSDQPGPFLLWMWHHGVLGLTDHPTLAEAVSDAMTDEDNGTGSFHAIEGATVAEVVAEQDRQRAEQDARDEAAKAATPTGPRYTVRVRTPEATRGLHTWALVRSTYVRAEADAAAERWGTIVGADRVEVAELKR